MKACVGGLALLLLLSACDPIRPTAGRYLCQRDQPLDTQCLEGWRCGADNYCFDPSGQGALPTVCADPSTDCPDGWKCSRNRTCFDPSKPTTVSLPCRDPETDCPTGWKCGLDQRCLDPAEPGPWRCADTARDCTGGWTCGANALCFDRADAGRVACRADVATDCNEGWRCGVDGLCQQLDAGFPWPCRVDGDCEAQWRCGPGGQCVDSAGEGLRPNSGMPQGAAFNLGWPAGRPDDLALGQWTEQVSCAGPLGSNGGNSVAGPSASGAVRFGSRLELFMARGSGGDLPLGCDGGAATAEAPILTGRVDLGNTQARQLAQFRATTFVLVDGGVRTYALGPGGEVNPGAFFAGSYEHIVSSQAKPCVLATGPTTIKCLMPGAEGETFASGPLTAVDGGVARVRDAIIWRYSQNQSEAIVFAATNQGLFARFFDNTGGLTSGWVHVEWGGAVSVIDELRLAPQPGASPLLLALVREGGGTETQIWTFSVKRFMGTTSAGVVTTWPGNYLPLYTRPVLSSVGWFELGWGQSYVSCGTGARGWLQAPLAAPLDPSGVGPTRSLYRCQAPDGGTELFQTLSTFRGTTSFLPVELRSELTPLTRDALWVRNDESSVAMADDEGGVYLASAEADRTELEPWLLPAAPDTVAGRNGRWLMARTEPREYSLGNGVVDATLSEGNFLGALDAGLLLTPRTLSTGGTGRVVAGVEGAPDFAVWEVASSSSATFLVETTAPGPLTTDLLSFPVSLADGGTGFPTLRVYAQGPAASAGMHASIAAGGTNRLWYLTKDDQLLVAAVDQPEAISNITLASRNGTLPLARVTLTPLPGVTVTHVLGLPADPSIGAAYGQALAVAGGRLLHVRANVVGVWRATDQSDDSSEVVTSWADGARVRFGDRRGRVRSFPSRVIIGPELPAGAIAWDFVDVCGVTYALSTEGVFRLAATAGVVVGTWAQVPLPPSLRFTTGGALHSDGTSLLVFDQRGLMAEVQGLTCAQPL